MTNNVVFLKRAVEGVTVPNGTDIKINSGEQVIVTQSLGGSFTLNVYGNLIYISSDYADALGLEAIKLPSDKAPVQENDVINEHLLWLQMKTVYDPEIPVNIVDLGLIYDMSFHKLVPYKYHISIQMTLTSPGCGMGIVLIKEIKDKLALIANVGKVEVMLLFEPPWNTEMMTDEARLALGFL
jgi:probable FeS assembly SUF system protein SufT